MRRLQTWLVGRHRARRSEKAQRSGTPSRFQQPSAHSATHRIVQNGLDPVAPPSAAIKWLAEVIGPAPYADGPQHTVRMKPLDRILRSELTLPFPPFLARKCCSRHRLSAHYNYCEVSCRFASRLLGLNRARILLRFRLSLSQGSHLGGVANKEAPGRIHRRPKSSSEACEPTCGESNPASVTAQEARTD